METEAQLIFFFLNENAKIHFTVYLVVFCECFLFIAFHIHTNMHTYHFVYTHSLDQEVKMFLRKAEKNVCACVTILFEYFS